MSCWPMHRGCAAALRYLWDRMTPVTSDVSRETCAWWDEPSCGHCHDEGHYASASEHMRACDRFLAYIEHKLSLEPLDKKSKR